MCQQPELLASTSPQISYASPSTELNDRQRFPNFFRTYPSGANYPVATIALLHEFGWKRAVVITQEESLFAAEASVH